MTWWSNAQIEMVFGSVGFSGGKKTGEPGEKPSVQGREPTTNSTHIWRWVRESKPGHIGGRRALSPLRHPCTPWKGYLGRHCIKIPTAPKLLTWDNKSNLMTYFQLRSEIVISYSLYTVTSEGLICYVLHLCIKSTNRRLVKWNNTEKTLCSC